MSDDPQDQQEPEAAETVEDLAPDEDSQEIAGGSRAPGDESSPGLLPAV